MGGRGSMGSSRSSRSGSGSGSGIVAQGTGSKSSSSSPMATSTDSLGGPNDTQDPSKVQTTLKKDGKVTLPHRSSFSASSADGLDKQSSSELGLNELQTMAEQAAHPSSGLVKDRYAFAFRFLVLARSAKSRVNFSKQKLRSHKNCFVGCELVDWLLAQRRANSRPEAVAIGQQLFSHKLIVRWLCLGHSDRQVQQYVPCSGSGVIGRGI